ncbi:MAG: choice-of-anchor B family protein [Ignavibacteriales bacterium]|nr:choice-of-anchor B family protein [Ignavibacteriales bacterium]
MKSLLREIFLIVVLIGWPIFNVHSQGSSNVQFLGNFNNYSATRYNDCWGYTAPDGREYALLGVRSGTSIIDITNAPTLTEVGFIPSALAVWKDIKTYRQYAYVVTDGSGLGLQIIDLSMLPDTAFQVKVDSSIFKTSHNIYIDTSRALLYIEGNASAPVRLWSLSDPANPVQVSTFGPSNQSIHDIYARGNRAYVSEGGSGSYSIWDVSYPNVPVHLKTFYTPFRGYAHNSWLSDDENFLMTTEETVGQTVKIFDISNLDSVRLRGEYLAPMGLAHNTHIKGRYAYISHYKDGLRIVDIFNPDAPVEAAHYDTYVGGLSGDYHGDWGAFPFFNSGKVLASDMEAGLFVVHFAGSAVTNTDSPGGELPHSYSLRQNYPNPFNPQTTITFELPNAVDVKIVVYNIFGQVIRVLAEGNHAKGIHQVAFEGRELASGVYFYTLTTAGFAATKKMVLMR